MSISVIITAAGRGSRFNTDKYAATDKRAAAGEYASASENAPPKQFYPLCGTPILTRTVSAFCGMDFVDEIIVTLPKGYGFPLPFKKISAVTAGGADRQASVYEALKLVSKSADIVLIHDGVRPFITDRLTRDIIGCVRQGYGAAAGIRATDTIKRTDPDGLIIHTPDRAGLWQVQTPQGFTYEVIMKAHELARAEGFTGTDDSALVERYKLAPVKMVEGDGENIKITTKRDIEIAEVYLKNR